MKVLIVTVVLIVFACFPVECLNLTVSTELQELQARAESENQNKEIVKRWISGVDKGNLVVVDELIDEDCKVYYGRETFGREWLRASCDTMGRSFSDGIHIIDDLIPEKDKVVARLTKKVTHTGEFMGVAPTGKRLEYHGFTLYRLESRRIKELWMDQNATLELMVKLGIMLQSINRSPHARIP